MAKPTRRVASLVSGPLAALLFYLVAPDTLPVPAVAAAAITLWVALWWFTEALPIGITSLLPLVLLPRFGVTTQAAATAPYADKIIFLFLGAFLIAIALEKWNLHRRFALFTVTWMGNTPAGLIGAFMATTAFISLWISNTAVCLMMLPVGIGVIKSLHHHAGDHQTHRHFAAAMVLGIAYSASIGGLGTIIGTPPNALLMAFMDHQYGETFGFAGWLPYGLPITLILLPLSWWLLTHIRFPMDSEQLRDALQRLRHEEDDMPPMGREEKQVLGIFVATALFWLMRPWIPGLDDVTIALSGALLLFILPNLLDRQALNLVPWHLLLLFGSGLSLAAALQSSGFTSHLAESFARLHVAPILIMLLITGLMVFIGEIASNTATAATFFPIVASLADGLKLPPQQLLIPAALAASLSFMTPVSTPPNALAFGSGYVTMRQMLLSGFWLNLISIMVVTLWIFIMHG